MPLVLLAMLVVALLIALCALAFHLAIYALPLMVGVTAFRLVYEMGAGFLVSGIAGISAALTSIVIAIIGLRYVKNPAGRLTLLVLFAAPSAIAGYMLVHGMTHAVVSSALTLNLLGGGGGLLVGTAAMRNFNDLSQRGSPQN
jgi:hypothetical protein